MSKADKLPSSMDQLLAQKKPETNPKEAQKQPQKRPDRVLSRASYDMTPDLKTAVSKRSKRLGIPASQFAMFLLSDALRRYDANEIDPTPYLIESDSPKFRNTLDIAGWYFEGD